MSEEKDVSVANEGQMMAKDKGEELTEQENAIIRQVEYYFGDLNLPQDGFLRQQIKLGEGWVPLEIIGKCNRLAKITNDINIIVRSLAKANSTVIEISEDNKKIRRHPENPVPAQDQDHRKEMMSRTVYVKGFPKNSTMEDMLEFFTPYEGMIFIRMRKYRERSTNKKLFKGSVFVTFQEREQAARFQSEHKEYGGDELEILWQRDFVEKQRKEYGDRLKDLQKGRKSFIAKAKSRIKLPKGTILKFTGATQQMKKQNIKDALTALGGQVEYISWHQDQTEGWVRLYKEHSAKQILAYRPERKIKIGDQNVIFKIVEGKEEDLLLKDAVDGIMSRRLQKFIRSTKPYIVSFFKICERNKRSSNDYEGAPPQKVKRF